MSNKIDWKNVYKIRIANSEDSFQHHEVTKLLLVMKLLNKHKSNKNWIRIYTEFKLNGLVPDIYFEDVKKKEVICYEIQKKYTKKWLNEKIEQYNNYEIPYFTLDFIPINLNKLSKNIEELNKQLNDFVF